MFRLVSSQTSTKFSHCQQWNYQLSTSKVFAAVSSISIRSNRSNPNNHFATVASEDSDSDSDSDYDDSTTSTSPSSAKGKFMLILGKPGGGKGTISNKILKDFPMFKHLSTGDLLRQHVRQQTPIGLQAKKHMDNGDLVPDEIMIQLVLQDAFDNNNDNNNNNNNNNNNKNDCNDEDDHSSMNSQSLLLDGFPRTMEQAVALEKSLQVDLVVDLDVPVDTIVERISDRWIHPGSGRIYNYSYNPPKVHGKDDITHEDLIQRDDDKPETVRKRLQAYDQVTAPLIQYYSDKGVLQTFKGTQSDVIYVDVQKWLKEQMEESE